MYAIEVIPDVARQIQELHPKRFKIVSLRVFALQMNPRPPDCMMIDAEVYRVVAGPYLISYVVDDSQRRVRVFLLEERGG
jgi:mRNA-degrading endonuclease RelE of RelBE toxin-antitoxin system